MNADIVSIVVEQYKNDEDGSINSLYYKVVYEGRENSGWQTFAFDAMVSGYQKMHIDLTNEGSYRLTCSI